MPREIGIAITEEIPQPDHVKARLKSFALDDPTCGYMDFLDHFFKVYPATGDRDKDTLYCTSKTEVDYLMSTRWPDRDGIKSREGFRVWLRAVHGIYPERPWRDGSHKPQVYYRLGRKNVNP
jgi:hypothetical protein